MADAFDAEISALAQEISQQTTRIREAYDELSSMKYTTSSRDGMVSVTVGRHGQVRHIELNPRAYRTLSPSQLADTIMQQINKATDAVSEQSKQLLQPFLPGDLPYEEVFGQHATLDAFFPGPVEPSP
ncbi:YbaB/EbfC family DNA-binding protein [Nonomuraea mesophila]|uniref:YbaB/EbfC family DNA-binding protein n=1 Tax=Nonomuraea mesophila TaxID=2530382 RepID=A0A4V2Z911_9ACTN|nr:YbaB/EbfC family nucleoid-associated protein [Nonomuraea mesophila]TDE42549.1 YbaB/EbfC family DNA-binding protein [Nonomuraea mesophila]